ncbi:UbiA family prenyltransferase [Neorhodopirellula pilleata]|uniref:Prenyltransferase n=1 Tax=Neorhodopirellula pilleata TaxID=2714738 RepID=A0A5C6A6R7_9BACT|nr:UbiA family prenyltransferase [Neorhodopirellula pilleata]TWT95090.1 prenyltransferase [Neorhodopirellula pilleata]
MEASPKPTTSPWIHWASLVRLPNVFTIIADVTAAFCVVLGGYGWRAGDADEDTRIGITLVLVILSGVCLYWGGMVLNDVFDVRKDLRARRGRPLADRSISVSTARTVAWGLLVLGIVFAGGIGWISLADATNGDAAPTEPSVWKPALIALLLVACIYLYDGPLKRTPVAPIVMGGCRILSFLLGATAAAVALGSSGSSDFAGITLGDPIIADIRRVTLTFALGMGTYIAGITTFGRREAIGDRTIHLPIGLALMMIGAALVAFAPRLAGFGPQPDFQWTKAWSVDPVWVFPAAIFLMVATTIMNGRKAVMSPSPIAIQSTIRSALMAIIPIAAAMTMLGLGAKPAIAVFALILPSTWLAQKFRMT